MTPAPDFLSHKLPSMAVACPSCRARAGTWCKRPSEHKAMGLHKGRHEEADRLWLKHDLPTITHRRDGTYVYDGPETRPSVTQKETPMATIGPKESQRRKLREDRAARQPKKTEPTAPAAADQQETTTMKTKAKAKTRKTSKKTPAKKRGAKKRPNANARTRVARKGTVPAQDVADFVSRPVGHRDAPLGGASMEELVARFKIEAHPMRAKIHYVRHELGYDVAVKDGRYHGTPPKKA